MKKLLIGLIVLVALLAMPMAVIAAESDEASTEITGNLEFNITITIDDATLGWNPMVVGTNTDETVLTIQSTGSYGVDISDSRIDVFTANCTEGNMCAGTTGVNETELFNPIDITCDNENASAGARYGDPTCTMTGATELTSAGAEFFQGPPDDGATVDVNVSQEVVFGDSYDVGEYSISILFTATAA